MLMEVQKSGRLHPVEVGSLSYDLQGFNPNDPCFYWNFGLVLEG